MIDFVRMNYRDKSIIEPFVKDPNNFEELRVVLEQHTGVIEYPYKTSLGLMEVKVTDKYVCVMNSLHKLYNSMNNKRNRNHNDFTYSQLVKTIELLESGLINLEDSTLSKVEFGLNIELDNPAELIVRNNLMMHKLKTHNHNKKFNGRGEYKQFNRSLFDIKIYDKAKQYNLSNNVIRIEIRHNKNRSFNQYGVYNIINLKSKDNLKMLFQDLMKRFEELTIIDDFKNDSSISEDLKKQIEVYTSHNYWQSLTERSLRNKRTREKRNFERLLVENNLLKTKSELRDKLNSKFEYLINN